MHENRHHHPAPDFTPEHRTGILPTDAPLAVPFVPFQRDNPPQYSPEDGFPRGTIFPGLDLPWQNTVNRSHPAAGTPLGEIMELEFAVFDLALYLDTHQHDTQAIEMAAHYTDLLHTARKQYVEEHGPLSHGEAIQDGKYTWLQDPWPWEYQERRG